MASGKSLTFLDFSVLKTVVHTEGTTEISAGSQNISNTNQVLEIVVPYDTTHNSIAVYRYHNIDDTTAEKIAFEKLSTRPESDYVDGTYFVGDGFVVIYAQKFSMYAIGHTTGTGSSGYSGGNYYGSSSGGSSKDDSDKEEKEEKEEAEEESVNVKTKANGKTGDENNI